MPGHTLELDENGRAQHRTLLGPHVDVDAEAASARILRQDLSRAAGRSRFVAPDERCSSGSVSERRAGFQRGRRAGHKNPRRSRSRHFPSATAKKRSANCDMRDKWPSTFESEHHEVRLSREEFFHSLPRLIWHEDEPIVWPSSVSLYFVARLARERVDGGADRRRKRRDAGRLHALCLDSAELAHGPRISRAHARRFPPDGARRQFRLAALRLACGASWNTRSW